MFSNMFMGNTGGAQSFAVFTLNIFGLIDTYGNVGTFTRAGSANVIDHTGTLVSVPLDTHRVNRGRYTSGVWFADDGAGNPLHPARVINGVSTLLDIKAYTTATAVPAGGSMEDAGRWYTSALGGNTAGATLLADTGVTDWVDNGVYNREYGVLLEAGATNSVSATNWRTPSMWGTGWGGTNNTRVQQTNGDAGVDGQPNTEVILSDVDAAIAGGNNINTPSTPGATNAITIAIRKNSATNIVRFSGTFYSASYISTDLWLDTATGELSTNSHPSSRVEDAGAHWIVSLACTDNVSGNTNFSLVVYPSHRATLNGPFDPTLTGSVTVDWPQIELNTAVSSSLISGGTVRQNELGNLTFPTNAGWAGVNAFPHDLATNFLTLIPQFDLADHGATNDPVVTLNNLHYFRQAYNVTMGMRDGAAQNNLNLPVGYYVRDDAMQFVLQHDATNSVMRWGYRNATTGQPWTFSTWVAYDGAFTDTGLYQFFATGGSTLGWVVRNNSIQRRLLTDAEIEGYVIA